jgi:hypothetical protein
VAYSSQGLAASGLGAISVGGSMGLGPNNSRARASRARTSSSCCCSAESAMSLRYPGRRSCTIHRPHKAYVECRYAWPVAIFGRITARQRLRRATRESLAVPAFSSPIDCTPWVTGGLWPAELSTASAETAMLAEYLRADLERIANSANDELKLLKRAGMSEQARQAAEVRVIDESRAHAERRVESAVRQLHGVKAEPAAGYPRLTVRESLEPKFDPTQVMPAVTEATSVIDLLTEGASQPRRGSSGRRRRAIGRDKPEVVQDEIAADEAAVPGVPDIEETQVIPVVAEGGPAPDGPAGAAREPLRQTVDSGRHHAVVGEPPVGEN